MDVDSLHFWTTASSINASEFILTCVKCIYNDNPLNRKIDITEKGKIIRKDNYIEIWFKDRKVRSIEDEKGLYEKKELVRLLNSTYHISDFSRWIPKDLTEKYIRDFFVNHQDIQYLIERDFKFIAGILDNQDIFKVQSLFTPR